MLQKRVTYGVDIIQCIILCQALCWASGNEYEKDVFIEFKVSQGRRQKVDTNNAKLERDTVATRSV